MSEEETTTTEQPQDFSLSLLAKERFGQNYHGSVPEPTDTVAEDDAVEQEDDVDDPVTDDVELDGDQATSEGESDEEQDQDSQTISSFDELIESQGWDREWAENIKVTGKVDGEAREFTLKELRDKAQMYHAADKRLEEAKAKRDELTKELRDKNQALQGQYATAARLIEKAENLLSQDTKNINWQQLREDDPAEYSAKKAEIAERREQVEQAKREAAQEYQQSVQQFQEQSQKQIQETLQKEHESLLEKLPEWKDEKKAAAGKEQLAKYLKDQGFGKEEIASAADHRLIVMAHKARLYDEGRKSVDTAKKKLEKVPKMVKPGAKKSPQDSQNQKIKRLEEQLSKTGSLDDAYRLRQAKRESAR